FVDGRKARTLAGGFFARAVLAGTRAVAIGTQDEGIVEIPAGHDEQAVPGPVTRIVEFDGVRYALAAGGLYRRDASGWRVLIDGGGVRSLYVFHGLVNNHVYTLGIDGDRTVAGTLGGLSLLDGDLVRASYTTANSSLRHNWITALARTGKDWLAGTYGAGVL